MSRTTISCFRWLPALLLALSCCTHHAGIYKRYEEQKPIAGTEVIPADATMVVEIATEAIRDGKLRGTVTVQAPGSLDYEIHQHEVGAFHEFDFFEATLWRAIVAPFHFLFLQPFTSDRVRDYGGDGAVGIGDRVWSAIHVLNPLMAWPFGSLREGEDRIVSSRHERRAASIRCPPDLELVLTSNRGSTTVPVPVAENGRFEVDLLASIEAVWDSDLSGELRERASGRGVAVRSLALEAGTWLTAIGRRTALAWRIACEQDTRAAYARFQAAHHGGEFGAEVAERLHALDWRDALAAGDRQALRAFVRMRPSSPHGIEARVRIEEIDWDESVRRNDMTGYEQFVAEHPDGVRTAAARSRLADLQQARSWERAQRLDTAAAYRSYVAAHPDAPSAARARARLDELEQHAAPWLATCAVGTAQAFRDFLQANPTGAYAGAAERALRDLEGRDIVELLDEGKVEVRTAGNSIQMVSVEVRRTVPYPLRVRLPIGSYFVAARTGAQNMVATKEATVELKVEGWSHVAVAAACANQPRDIPGHQDTFTIERPQHFAELARLMPCLDRAKVDYSTRQAAVWIVTDDASYEAMGNLVLRPVGSPSGGSRVIGPEAVARAIQLCAEAGIAVEGKRILADRPLFLPSVPDGELKAWLEAIVPGPQKALIPR